MLKIWSKYQQKRQRPLTTHHTHLPMATHWPLPEPFWAMIADSAWRMLEDDFVGNCNRPKAEPSKRPHEWSPLPTTLVKFLLFAHLNIRLQFNLVAATDFVAYLPSRLVLVTHFRCLKNPNVLFLGNYPHVFAQNSHVFYLSLLAPIYIYIYILYIYYIYIHIYIYICLIGFWVSQWTKSVIHGRWSPAAATSQCRPSRWHKASKASEGARAEASSSLRKMTWDQGNCSTWCPESNVINTHMDWWLKNNPEIYVKLGMVYYWIYEYYWKMINKNGWLMDLIGNPWIMIQWQFIPLNILN